MINMNKWKSSYKKENWAQKHEEGEDTRWLRQKRIKLDKEYESLNGAKSNERKIEILKEIIKLYNELKYEFENNEENEYELAILKLKELEELEELEKSGKLKELKNKEIHDNSKEHESWKEYKEEEEMLEDGEEHEM